MNDTDMTVATAQLHHIALTVRDLDASVMWYEQVFGIKYKMDAPHVGGEARLLANDTFQLVIVLHRHDANVGETFLESRTGLDHVGLGVPTREDLVAWQAHLESHGVVRAAAADRPLTQSPIADEPYGAVLVFRDLDNLQLELFAPPPSDH
jgi:glyoxylase I family protein